MRQYEDETKDAIQLLKNRLRPGEASEVDVCLAEAASYRAQNGNPRSTPSIDQLITHAGGDDSDDANTLQEHCVRLLIVVL